MIERGFVWLWFDLGAGEVKRERYALNELPRRRSRPTAFLGVGETAEAVLTAELNFGAVAATPGLAGVIPKLSRIDDDFRCLNRCALGELRPDDGGPRDWSELPFSPWYAAAGAEAVLSSLASTLSPTERGFLQLTPFHAEHITVSAAQVTLTSGFRPSEANRFGQQGWTSLVIHRKWSVLEWLIAETDDLVPGAALSDAALYTCPGDLFARLIDRASDVPADVVNREVSLRPRRALVRRLGADGWSPIQRAIRAGADLNGYPSERLLVDAVAHAAPERIREVPEAQRKGSGVMHPARVLAESVGWVNTKQLAAEGVIPSIDSATRLFIAQDAAFDGDTDTLAELLDEGGFDFGALVDAPPPSPAAVIPCLQAAGCDASRLEGRVSYLAEWLAVTAVHDPDLQLAIVSGVDTEIGHPTWAEMPEWFVCGALARVDDAKRPVAIADLLLSLVRAAVYRGFLSQDQQTFDAVFRRWPVRPEGSVLAACQRPSTPTAWTRVLLDVGVDPEQVEAWWGADDNVTRPHAVSALGMACYYARVENAAMLLRAGADPDRRVKGGHSVTHLAGRYPTVQRTLQAAQQLVREQA